ncbi:Monocopper oxidase-like protein SKS2 [Rhynchospora pubera]|uniref:Monocopper oxidase-like protein SKS2 n=1 Tax=Rhynchospora pubera TaxID=906938 RepID=A0AAV8GTG3_9POAL|nr:Monocopper oxidase-like protein SKS2 [Rhynchospora pubera]KAJ4744327.1 Monocopper oxidase-like protein SKS2 [Rhynchospora pubera]KAJ4805742.1 Monocopper oxidase-like protein SKS2 [Rhynchospora pubera]
MQSDEAGIAGDPSPETAHTSDEPQATPGEVSGAGSHDTERSSSGAYTMGDQREIMKALETVERDAVAIAESFSSLFSSLRLGLSEATSTSIENMECFSEVIGRLQESALDAASKGNKYINSCLRLNEELRGLESLAMQLKLLRRNVDSLDLAVTRLLRLP